jgi:hypothetical protein
MVVADPRFCGDKAFWRRVAKEWTFTHRSRGHLSFWGLQGDAVAVARRNSASGA